MQKEGFSLISRFKSFRFAFSGITSLIRHEHNSWIHLVAAVLAIVIGLLLHISIIEWCVISFAIGLVFITELINSAIELIGDMVDTETNPKIKQIKDYAAASVLISAITAMIAGLLIFVPKLIELIK